MSIIAGKYPQSVVEDGCTVGRASRGEVPRDPVFPVDPLAGGEFVLVQVVLVSQVRVGVDVARVAAKHEHAIVEDHSRVVIARGRRGACEIRDNITVY